VPWVAVDPTPALYDPTPALYALHALQNDDDALHALQNDDVTRFKMMMTSRASK
jgi:hypothetical protein